MVEFEVFESFPHGANDPVGQIILRPNYSMGWRASAYFLATLMLVSIGIGLSFALQGMWMILPFSVLEMSVLAASLYLVLRRSYIQEVVRFTPDQVVVEIGRTQPDRSCCWQRFYTRIFVEQPAHPWHAKKILLRHQGEELEIGSFLNNEDKTDLVGHLQTLVQLADQSQHQAT